MFTRVPMFSGSDLPRICLFPMTTGQIRVFPSIIIYIINAYCAFSLYIILLYYLLWEFITVMKHIQKHPTFWVNNIRKRWLKNKKSQLNRRLMNLIVLKSKILSPLLKTNLKYLSPKPFTIAWIKAKNYNFFRSS